MRQNLEHDTGTALTDFVFIHGLLFGLVLAAPVGPVGVMCIQRTLTEGRLHGTLSGLGAAVGDALYGAVAAFGIGAVADWITGHQAPLRLVGGIVLLVLAARTILGRPRGSNNGGVVIAGIHTGSLFQDFVSTFVLTIANPITLLTFAGLFATLGVTQAGESAAHAGWLILGVFLGSAAWWLALGLTAGCFRSFLNDGYEKWVKRVSAAILLAFGVYALASLLFLQN